MDTTPTTGNPWRTGRRVIATGAFAVASVFGLAACGDDDDNGGDVEQELEDTGEEVEDLGEETGDELEQETEEEMDEEE